jgi:hypothetical protein
VARYFYAGLVQDTLELPEQGIPAQSVFAQAQDAQYFVGRGALRLFVVSGDARVVMLKLVPSAAIYDEIVKGTIDVGRGELVRSPLPNPVKILHDHLKEHRHWAAQTAGYSGGQSLRHLDRATLEHATDEFDHLLLGQHRQSLIVKVIDFIQASHPVERAGKIDRASQQPSEGIAFLGGASACALETSPERGEPDPDGAYAR